MNKIVELKIEETKAVVGGSKIEATATAFRPPMVGMLPPPSSRSMRASPPGETGARSVSIESDRAADL